MMRRTSAPSDSLPALDVLVRSRTTDPRNADCEQFAMKRRQRSQGLATFIYTTGTRRAASIAGEITSMSSGTCQRLVSRTSGGALPAFAPSSTKPS